MGSRPPRSAMRRRRPVNAPRHARRGHTFPRRRSTRTGVWCRVDAVVMFEDEGPRHEPAHAVRHHRHPLEAEPQLEIREVLGGEVRDGVETGARRIEQEPGLETRAVEARDQLSELLRVALGAVHEEHRNLLRIVRLEKVDPGADLPREGVDVEVAEHPALRAEAGIGEVRDRAVDRHRIEAYVDLVLVRRTLRSRACLREGIERVDGEAAIRWDHEVEPFDARSGRELDQLMWVRPPGAPARPRSACRDRDPRTRRRHSSPPRAASTSCRDAGAARDPPGSGDRGRARTPPAAWDRPIATDPRRGSRRREADSNLHRTAALRSTPASSRRSRPPPRPCPRCIRTAPMPSGIRASSRDRARSSRRTAVRREAKAVRSIEGALSTISRAPLAGEAA